MEKLQSAGFGLVPLELSPAFFFWFFFFITEQGGNAKFGTTWESRLRTRHGKALQPVAHAAQVHASTWSRVLI
jgi:hypothetical protein